MTPGTTPASPGPGPGPAPAVVPKSPGTVNAFELGDNTMLPWGVNATFKATFPRARWIWGSANAEGLAPVNINYEFRTTFSVAAACAATVHVIADNSASVVLNGTTVATNIGGGWGGAPNAAEYPRIKVTLAAGTNVLLISAANGGEGPNPAGLLAGVVRDDTGTVLTQTDSTWSVRTF